MEEIIRQMIDCDNEAKEIVSDAKEKRETLSAQIEREQESIRKEIEEAYREKLSQLKEEEKQKEQEESARTRTVGEKRRVQMEKLYREKKEEWKENLLREIIG